MPNITHNMCEDKLLRYIEFNNLEGKHIDLSDVEVYYIAQIFNTRREKTIHKIQDTHLSVCPVFFY